MVYLFRMAARNVGRNRRRSFLAALSVAIAIYLVVFLQGFMGGFQHSIVDNYTRMETGHVRITSRYFAEHSRFNPVVNYLENPEKIVSAIRGDDVLDKKVETIAQRISFGVLLSHDGKNKTVAAVAGDPRVEKDLLLLEKSILPGGRYIRGEREIIMGSKTAEALGYEPGDTVKVMTQGADYALHLRKLTIVGLFETGMNLMDDGMFQMTLRDARELLRMHEGTQQIVLMLGDYGDADLVAERLRSIVNDEELSIMPWTGIGEYYRLITLQERMMSGLSLIVALLGAFIIGNIMTMVVLERRREIGIMKSMGFSRFELLTLFLTEGAILGIIGSAVGATAGLGTNVLLHYVDILDFSASMKAVSMPVDNVIHTTIDPGGAVLGLVLGTLISALVSLIPSRRAARMNAVESIKAAG